MSDCQLLASHRFQDAHPDSFPVVKHAYLFSKASVELPAGVESGDTAGQVNSCLLLQPSLTNPYTTGLRPENTRLFHMPMRLVACTMQEQHPGDPIKSPLQPSTPLASHIRKNRRRRPLRQSLKSVLAMSPGSPESPTRSGSLSFGIASPLKTPLRSSPHEGAGVGSTSVFRWVWMGMEIGKMEICMGLTL